MTTHPPTDPHDVAATRMLLPPGRQLAVTWGVTDRHGGMTGALLHRSRAFVREAGAAVDVITFDPRQDGARLETLLRGRGAMIDGMRLLNLYADARRWHRAPRPVAHQPATLASRSPDTADDPNGPLLIWGTDDRVERMEHRRLDGSLALLDERERAQGPRRLLTSFDEHGATTGQWTGAWPLYAHWLDELLAEQPAFAIVDSKTIAPFMATYQRENVTLIHLVHGSHLSTARKAAPGVAPDAPRLGSARASILERSADWAAVVLLTERQRADVATQFGDSGTLAVIPNSVSLPDGASVPAGTDRRDPLHGVIIAHLTRRKRLTQALEIVARVRAAGIPVTLEVIGDGPERAALQERARALGLDAHVRFTGYAPEAAEAFAAASWTLLVSRAEGAPLVLLEAMARGCLPLAYDIPYGPSDMIDPGADGFLVADGDIEAAAATLAELCRLDETALPARRAAARAAAERFADRPTVQRWGALERSALARRGATWSNPLAVRSLRVRTARGRHRVIVGLAGGAATAPVVLQLRSTQSERALRVPTRGVGSYRIALLTESQSSRLGRGWIEVRVLIGTPLGEVARDVGRRVPDTRPLTRVTGQRLRGLISRAAVPALRGSRRYRR